MKEVIASALVSASIVVGLGSLYIANAEPSRASIQIEVCEYEDGNTSGKPCLWVDDDSGQAYLVSSENYR